MHSVVFACLFSILTCFNKLLLESVLLNCIVLFCDLLDVYLKGLNNKNEQKEKKILKIIINVCTPL